MSPDPNCAPAARYNALSYSINDHPQPRRRILLYGMNYLIDIWSTTLMVPGACRANVLKIPYLETSLDCRHGWAVSGSRKRNLGAPPDPQTFAIPSVRIR